MSHIFPRTTRHPEFVAPFDRFSRRAALVMARLKYEGIGKTISWFTGREKQDVDQGYDFGGIIEINDLDYSVVEDGDATRYEATDHFELRRVIDSLRVDPSQYEFVDYGSGKGAALIVAARYPFQSVTGVELSHQLHATAEANIQAFRYRGLSRTKSLRSANVDAAVYQPGAPLMAFFYNPFGPDILSAVLDRIAESAATSDTPSYVLYKNPVQGKVLIDDARFTRVSEPFGGSWFVYKTVGT